MTNKNEAWRGYTLEELRFRQVLINTKIEIEKEKLGSGVAAYQKRGAVTKSLWGRFVSAFDYADYAILAFSIGRRIFRLFRRRR